jgi:hypothetical protein
MTAQATAPIDEQVDKLLGCDPELAQDPYPLYERLRREAPVIKGGAGDTVLVSRYRDIETVLVDRATAPAYQNGGYPVGSDRKPESYGGRQFSAAMAALGPQELDDYLQVIDWHAHWMVRQDGDAHRRLRGLTHRAFTPRNIAKLTDRVQEIADELLDTCAEKGEIDVVQDYAFLLPLTVISEMIDVPAADRMIVHAWSEQINGAIGGDPRYVTPGAAALREFRGYLGEIIEHRRRQTTSDILGTLIGAEDGGDRLDDEELFVMMSLFLVAGHETTTKGIANALNQLMVHRDQWDVLCADPGLSRRAVEETLRFDGPVHGTWRVAVEDTELRGVPIAVGDTVLVCLASGNRDEEMFVDPGRLDITRQLATKDQGKQIAFGLGPHFCLGANLNRLETGITLETFARRFPDMERVTEPEWETIAKGAVRGINAMTLSIGEDHR